MYLTTPSGLVPDGVSPDTFCDLLLKAVEQSQAAALLVDLGSEAAAVAQLDKYLLPRLQDRDFAFLLRDRADLLAATGADGLHLSDPAQLKSLRSKLGDLSIGVECPPERHAAMIAAEAGADYVAFDLTPAAPESSALVKWWSEMMTVPSVVQAETPEAAAVFAQAGADFIITSAGVWNAVKPLDQLRVFAEAITPSIT